MPIYRPGDKQPDHDSPDERQPGRKSPEKRDKATAYAKALGMLARREHSRRELGRKLRQGGYEAEEATDALDRLGAQHYQDDERFGEMLVRSRAAQGYGPVRLRAELKITVLLVEHHMNLVMGISDHVHVLNFGRTIADGPLMPVCVIELNMQ